MNTNRFKEMIGNQKNTMMDIFKYEDSLLTELDRYEDILKSIGKAESSLDIALLTVYKAHVKNIKYLLDNLHTYKKLDVAQDNNIDP